MADVLAEAIVRIRADGSALRRDIQRDAGAAANAAAPRAGRDFGEKFSAAASAALRKASPAVSIDTTAAKAKIDQLKAKAGELEDREVRIDADITRAKQKLATLADDIQQAAEDKRVSVDADIGLAKSRLNDLRRQLGGLSGDSVIKVEAQVASAQAKLRRLEQQRRELDDDQVKIRVDAETAAASTKLRQLEAQKNGITAARVKVDADIAAALAKLKTLETAIRSAGSGGRAIRIDVDTAGALAKIAAVTAAIGGISAVAVGAAGALAGIGAVGGAGLGAAVAGFTGVGDALKAMEAKAQSSGAAVKVSASAVRAASSAVAAAQRDYRDALDGVGAASRDVAASQRGVVDAQKGVEAAVRGVAAAQRDYQASIRSIDDAQEGYQAALRGVTSAQQGYESATRAVASAQRYAVRAAQAIGDAQKDVERAIRSVSDAQRDAQRALGAVSDAEASYQDALRDERIAQLAVNDARKAAQEQLEDLRLATADMALSQESAALSVAEAQERLADVMSDESATALEKRRAELAVRQAKQRVVELADAADDLAKRRAEADAKGVDGSDLVVAANKRVQDSSRNVRTAQQRVADAQQAAADAARRVQDANEGVADAQRRVADASDAAAEAAQRVTDANRGVESAAQGIADANREVTRSQQGIIDAQQASVDSAQRVRDAQDGVAAAQQRVRDAQQQAVDSAKALARAQEDVGLSAQKITDAKLRLAEVKAPAAASAAAVDKLALAMANLGPNGQKFATFLRGFVDGPLKDLRLAGQEAFLPGVQAGLEKVQPLLKQITPEWAAFSGKIGEATGALIVMGGELGGPFLRFANAGLEGLRPLGAVLQSTAVELGAVFTRLEESGQAEQAMKALGDVIGAILPLIPTLVEGGAKLLIALGPGLTAVVKSLSDTIEDWMPQIEGAGKALGSLLEFVSPVAPELLILVGALTGLKKVGALGSILDATSTALGKLRSSADDAERSVSRTGTAMGKISSAAGAAGAALAVAGGLDAVFRSGDKAQATVNETNSALLKLKTGGGIAALDSLFQRTSNYGEDNVRGFTDALSRLANPDLNSRLNKLGSTLTFSLVKSGQESLAEQFSKIGQSLADLVNSGNAAEAKRIFDEMAAAAAAQGLSIQDLNKVMPQYQDALLGLQNKASGASTAVSGLGQGMPAYQSAVAGAALGTDGAAASIDRMNAAAQRASETFLSGEQANIRYGAAVDRAKQSIEENGATVSLNTEKGRANRQALLDMASAANDVVKGMQDQNAPIGQVNAQYEQQRKKLLEVGTQMFGSQQKAKTYVDQLLKIPTQRSTSVNVDTTKAIGNLEALQRKLIQTAGVLSTPRNAGTYGQGLGVYAPVGRAAGGWVPGQRSRRDTVPAMLAGREFVVNSDAAADWGPVLERINAGARPGEAMAGGEARAAAPAAATQRAPSMGGSGLTDAKLDRLIELLEKIHGQGSRRGDLRLSTGQLVGALDGAWGRGF